MTPGQTYMLTSAAASLIIVSPPSQRQIRGDQLARRAS